MPMAVAMRRPTMAAMIRVTDCTTGYSSLVSPSKKKCPTPGRRKMASMITERRTRTSLNGG